MTHDIGRRRSAGRGAALLEFVLVAALFIFLLFGIMEMGFMASNSTTVTMVAHQGARAAALGQGPAVVASAVANAASSLRHNADTTYLSYTVVSKKPDGTLTTWTAGGNWAEGKTITANTDDQVIVTVTYKYDYITGSLLGSIGNLLSGGSGTSTTSRNLTGRAVVRYGG